MKKIMWVNSYQELLNFPTYCTEKQKEIHSKENNSEHIAVNKDDDFVRQIKIDGDILPTKTSERRADYLVLNETKQTAYLIELKGSHIKSAFVQLENTDKNLSDALKECKMTYWRVVCGSRTANLKNNEVKKYQKNHPQLLIKRSVLRENI